MNRMLLVLLITVIFAGSLQAAGKTIKAEFQGCEAGNRGAACKYKINGGKVQYLRLPQFEYTEKARCVDPSAKLYGPKCVLAPQKWELTSDFSWSMDGVAVSMKPQDGGWAGPDLPEFDPAKDWRLGSKYKGCPMEITRTGKAVSVNLIIATCQ